MADADDSGRNPRSKGTANPTQLGMAQKRYREFDKKANTEYERLHAIDKKNKLTPNVNPTEHAFFVYLCALREGRRDPLRAPRAQDAAISAANNEQDPSVTAVETEHDPSITSAENHHSASPTPPPASPGPQDPSASQGRNLADDLALMAARALSLLLLTESRVARCCGRPIWRIKTPEIDAYVYVCDHEIQSDTVRYSQICTAFKNAYVYVFRT